MASAFWPGPCRQEALELPESRCRRCHAGPIPGLQRWAWRESRGSTGSGRCRSPPRASSSRCRRVAGGELRVAGRGAAVEGPQVGDVAAGPARRSTSTWSGRTGGCRGSGGRPWFAVTAAPSLADAAALPTVKRHARPQGWLYQRDAQRERVLERRRAHGRARVRPRCRAPHRARPRPRRRAGRRGAPAQDTTLRLGSADHHRGGVGGLLGGTTRQEERRDQAQPDEHGATRKTSPNARPM